MKLQKALGSTSEIWQLFIQDSSSTVGAGLAGLTNASGSLTAYYHRDTDTTATAISLVSMTVGTFTSSGFKEIDSANMPGWYQFCPPNAALASGAKSVGIVLKGATNMAQLNIEVQLTASNVDDGVRLGLTALPNAAAEASGGLPTLSAAQGSNGTIQANVHRWLTSTPNALQSGRVDSYLGAVASGVIAAASFASGALDAVWSTTSRTLSTGAIVAGTFAANALDAVWSTTTRLLTAGTNIVLAKGTGVTGFNDIAATDVVSAGAITTTSGKVAEVVLTDTLTTYTGNTVQTGDAYARIGAAGAGLTALGDTRIANLNATVGSRAVPGDAMALTTPYNTLLTDVQTQVDLLPADPASEADVEAAIAASTVAIEAAIAGATITPASAAAISEAVWTADKRTLKAATRPFGG